MARIVGVFGLVMALRLPAVAGAQMDLSDDNRLLTIAGQVAADQKAAAAYGQAGVSIGFVGGSPDKLVWVGVVKAQDGSRAVVRASPIACGSSTPRGTPFT